MDRRLTPFSGRIALSSLRGLVAAEAFTDGRPARIAQPITALLTAPEGARDRQLLLGDAVRVIDERDGHTFVQAEKDGYCGWVTTAAIGADQPPSHWISAPFSHAYSAPKVQAPERVALPMNAQLRVLSTQNGFAQTAQGFVPLQHLRALAERPQDPVTVAERFLHSPYLWGGNAWTGVDCSGLVQLAFHACARPCPGDSDLQQALGQPLPEAEAHQRGDLIFWKGHVALVVDAETLIHANGHSMDVSYENIADTITRIAAAGGGDVTARRRP